MLEGRVLVLCGLGGVAALFAYACGGTGDAGLDSGPPDTGAGMDVLVDNTVPTGDGSLGDASSGDAADGDGGVVDAGPLCLQSTCVVQLAVGGFHACGLVKDGTVRCWGRNNYGQLGVGLPGDGGAFDPNPRPVPQTPPLSGVSQISASHFSIQLSSTCALVGSAAQCFGNNSYGQLGLSADAGAFDNNPHPTPSPVTGVPGLASVWAGNLHGCAVSTTGDMYCWGDDQNMELGRPAGNVQILPAGLVVTDAGPATAVGPGYDFGLGLLKAGGVVSWGSNSVDQLGRTPAQSPDLAAAIGSLSGVTSIAAGFQHACAVAGGALYCWGHNANGQAGSSGDPVSAPTKVDVAGKTLVQVTAGYSHTCVLASDHTVYCWGQNDFGQCGTGLGDAGFNNADVTTPTQVQGLSGQALEVQAGSNHTCARIDGGSVMCWGANDRGQLGQGLVDGGVPMDTSPHPTPVTVVFP
ncbi:MAG TPA: hypothetical protein VLM85_04080 [Polyangiaceae bacterium]|nr:hypothetical protein [Polyangiaceae bacterium]